jgi:hypothetical protein
MKSEQTEKAPNVNIAFVGDCHSIEAGLPDFSLPKHTKP